MNFKYTFKGAESHEQLSELLEEKIQKLNKLQIKPIESVETLFRMEGKTTCEVEIKTHGGDGPLVTIGRGDTFLDAIEKAVDHLQVQMKRRKDKIQNHKA